MKAPLLALLSLLAMSPLALTEKARYDGYQVLRIEVASHEHAKILAPLESTFDFWTDLRVGGTFDMMVSPQQVQAIRSKLAQEGISHFVHIDNVQELIDAEDARQAEAKARKAKSGDTDLDFESYHSLDEIYEWFDSLEETFDSVTTEVIGQSYEGRDQRVLKICSDGCTGSKPAMFIDGGIHAREWISPATVTFMINELTVNLASTNADLVEELDWYFVPSVNPDGYAFTQSDDRMWRKTRSIQDGALCVGVDANRNYGYEWNHGGASDSVCSDTYHGPSAFSEVEVANIRDFLDSRSPQIKFFNDLHSYGQLILHPWGYTRQPVSDYDDLQEVFNRGNEALYAIHGKEYEVGCIPCVLYDTSGTAVDWGYGGANIKYTVSIELRDEGRYGFQLPADQIIPTGEEAFAFHASVARDVIGEFA